MGTGMNSTIGPAVASGVTEGRFGSQNNAWLKINCSEILDVSIESERAGHERLSGSRDNLWNLETPS
jgi:hypothetical protein